MGNFPPQIILRFLRWFCKEEYLEEIEGDLFELFEKHFEESPAKAKWAFGFSVIRYFRPGFIRSFKQENFLTGPIMLKSDLKISWRSLKKQPFFTFLNTFGLAVGMAGALLISLFIYDELSFDKMFDDSDRIYRLNIDHQNAGELNRYAAVSSPLANVMKQDYPQAELITRFKNTGSVFLKKVDSELFVKENHVVGADSSFFKMFGLDLIRGDSRTAFSNPNTLVLTRTAAEKHFGIHEALGQTLIMDDEESYVVSGVMEDLPGNSFLRDHSVFISMPSFEDADGTSWNNWVYPTFVKLLPTSDPENLDAYLATVKERYLIPWAMTFIPGLSIESAREAEESTGSFMNFNAIPLTDIHLYSPNIDEEFSQNSDVQNVYILSIIGFFLILLACVNFMNLSTAESLKRAKEVGIRKTLGSNRLGLIRQFLTEAGLISFLSFLLALALAFFALPFFNEFSEKAMVIPFESSAFWLLLMASVAFLGFLSGSYPAFFMSRFMPIKVLKGNGQASVEGGAIRNSLVVFQFSISIFLIVSTLVVFQQLNFIQNKDLGFQKDQILVIDDVDAAGNQMESFKQDIKQISHVENVSTSSFLPTPSARNGVTFFPEGSVFQPEKALIIGNWRVDYEYVSILDLEIIAGRDFDEEFATDSSGMILNESVVAMLGIEPEEALGMRLTKDFDRPDKENTKFLTVIGVVKNFHFETLRNSIDAMSLSLGNNPQKMIVKLNAGNFQNSIADIEKLWRKVVPEQPFNYYFMDDSFNETYEAELQLGRIFATFTILSIFIACLGLFGLAAFNAERRTKEIGIRKVLGASVQQITYRLSIDFLKLVGIAVLVSLPLGWYAMSSWLQDFSYRIEIGVEVFILAALLAVFVSLLTVSYQSIKAAIMDPVKSLKSE